MWDLSTFPHRNSISRGFRKWRRGSQVFCDFRMSQPQMGEEKSPAGGGFFQGFIAPSWKESPQTQISHCLELAVSPQGEFQEPKGRTLCSWGKILAVLALGPRCPLKVIVCKGAGVSRLFTGNFAWVLSHHSLWVLGKAIWGQEEGIKACLARASA